MKKLIILLFLPVFVFAKSFLISSIPLPKTYIMNVDPYECNEECMQSYLDKGMIFSFLAHAQSKLSDEKLDEMRVMNMAILNVGSQQISSAKVRIAILLPYRIIGKYAPSTTNAAFAYLMTKTQPFELKSYKVESESEEDLRDALNKIRNDDFDFVVAPLTQNGANNLAKIDPQFIVFIPTVNKKDANSASSYLFYGGIDYKAQTDLLLEQAAPTLAIFYDDSSISTKLAEYEEATFKNKSSGKFGRVLKYSVPAKTTNLKNYLDKNNRVANGSFFINTPVVKTGMIMSQITLYDVNYKNILSTQINYDPLLLSMTQINDRKNMIVANSITGNTNVLVETNSLLNNDIVYDWINYTTTVGIDYFFNRMTNEDREYNLPMVNNQIVYQIELLKPSYSRFVPFESDL
jgi:SRSO17 transposase